MERSKEQRASPDACCCWWEMMAAKGLLGRFSATHHEVLRAAKLQRRRCVFIAYLVGLGAAMALALSAVTPPTGRG